ncbi:ABC transporter G family member 15 [Glycine max]|nr:ABC transporter G family member 15 [Glycine max]
MFFLRATKFGHSIHIDEVFQQSHIRRDIGQSVDERSRRTHRLTLFTLLWRRVLGLGVEPNLLVEGTRDESTRIKTLLMIFKVEIVASHKKGKQHVVHMIQKRLYNSDNDFHKVRMRFANKEGNEQMNVNFNCNFTRFNHFSCNSYYLTHTKFFDPGRDKVVAPIVRFENVDIIAEPSAVLDVPNSPDPFMNLATAQIKATLVEKYRRSTYATRAKNRIQELSIDEGLQPPTQHGSQASWWKQLFNTDKEIICEHV